MFGRYRRFWWVSSHGSRIASIPFILSAPRSSWFPKWSKFCHPLGRITRAKEKREAAEGQVLICGLNGDSRHQGWESTLLCPEDPPTAEVLHPLLCPLNESAPRLLTPSSLPSTQPHVWMTDLATCVEAVITVKADLNFRTLARKRR